MANQACGAQRIERKSRNRLNRGKEPVPAVIDRNRLQPGSRASVWHGNTVNYIILWCGNEAPGPGSWIGTGVREGAGSFPLTEP